MIYYARVVVTLVGVTTTRVVVVHPLGLLCALQMVTLRQWQPLVAFVLYWRDAALQAIDHFERAQKHVLGLRVMLIGNKKLIM